MGGPPSSVGIISGVSYALAAHAAEKDVGEVYACVRTCVFVCIWVFEGLQMLNEDTPRHLFTVSVDICSRH